MRKPKTLSDLTAASVRPRARRREYPDAALPGLYLIVQPSGVKSWAYRTRIDRRPVKITLGRFDQRVFGVTAARDAARTALATAQSGALQRAAPAPLLLAAPVAAAPLALPAPASQDEPAPGTVGAVWADYLRLHLEPTAPASVKKYTSSMKRVLPLWNDRPVAEISRKDVMEVTDAALARGPEARNTTIVALSSFFNWCLSRDLVAASPVTVKKIKQEDRDRVLTDDEVRVFWKGCTELGPIFGPMFQLLLLTGCRRDEVAGMQWAEINGKVWSIPGSRTKNGQPLDVTLTDQALATLALMPRVEGCAFVFTTNGRTAASGFSKAKLFLDALTPNLTDYTLHDLRRTFATGLGRLGVSGPMIERCLNHTVPGVAGIYNRFAYAADMAAAWKLWSDHVASLAEGRRK
jgi:integrase